MLSSRAPPVTELFTSAESDLATVSSVWPLDCFLTESGHCFPTLATGSQIAHSLTSRWGAISSRVEVLRRRVEQMVGPMPMEGSGSGNANRTKAAGEKFCLLSQISVWIFFKQFKNLDTRKKRIADTFSPWCNAPTNGIG